MKILFPTPRLSISAKLIALIFTAAAVGIFFGFFFRHPVDWLQAETLRLRYYGLQAGLKEGPLSASLNRYDLLKPLVWEAQGGMFDGRYPIMLFDALIPKFYQYFYAWRGPSLREPVNLAFIFLTWLFLALLIREWFGSTAAGLTAASFWLLTSQTLLDAHYPIRPNMTILTFLLIYIFWELVRLRRLRIGWFCLFRVGLALTAAIFTHEFALIFVPLVLLFFVFERRSLRRRIVPAAAVSFASWAVYLVSLFLLLPPLAEEAVGRCPPMDWMTGGLAPILADPLILAARVRDFALTGLRELVAQNLGAGCFLPVLLRLLGPAAAAVFLIAVGAKALWGALKPLLVALLYFLAVALLMFPVIPSTVEMPVYYYATIVALFILPVGAALAGISPPHVRLRRAAAAGALLLIGVLNFAQSSRVLKQMPGDFGFNDTARIYTRDVLSFPPGRRAEGFFPFPVYTAYPRPRVFDISRRWDIMLRVWQGRAEQVFSMLMPVLNLRLYERGQLIGDPGEFAALRDENPQTYEAGAAVYWDMPARRLYLLERIRAVALKSGGGLSPWIGTPAVSASADVCPGKVSSGLLGEQPRVPLAAGRWERSIPPPASNPNERLAMIFAIRADLFPPGPDDVMDRVTPLPERFCRISLRSADGEEIFAGEQTFGWSWQLFQVTLSAIENLGWKLTVESEAEVEVIGPVMVPSAALVDWGISLNEDAGIDSVMEAIRSDLGK